MAVKELKTRFKLEGEQQFKKAMSDSAAAVKVLNSEEKLAEAQFHATGDAQTYAAEKSRILKEQIKQQESAVKAAEDAVKKLTEQGVQPNAREMQQWQTKLNNARTNLANMQTKLNNVETELGEQKTAVKDAKDETKNYNDEMGKVAQGVNLQNTITAIDNLKGHIENVVKKATQAARAMWEMGADSGKWADDLITTASQLNVGVEELQGWQYASKFIDTEVGTISAAMARLVNPSKAATEQLNQLGVALTGPDGKAKTRNDLFWDTVEAITALGDAEKQESAAQALFGKKFSDLNPLIQAGRDKWNEYIKEAQDAGYILSNDQVMALGGVDDTIQKMNQSLESLKNTVMSDLSPAFESIGKLITDTTDKLLAWAKSDEGKAALEALGTAITDVITALTGEIDFKKVVDDAAKAVSSLGKGFKWISDNKELVAGAITSVAGAYAALSVSKEVLLFMQLLKATPLSKLGALFGGGAAKAGADAASAAAPAVAAGAKAFLPAAIKVLGPVAAFAYGMKPAATADDDLDVMFDENGNPTRAFKEQRALEGKLNGQLMVLPGSESEEQRAERQKKNLEELKQKADDAKTAARELFQELSGKYGVGQNGATGEWELVNSDNSQEAKDGIALLNQLYEAAEKAEKNYKSAALRAGDGMAEGFNEKSEDVAAAANAVGENASVAFANGINARAGEARRAAETLAEQVTAIMREALQIHSPSRVFEQMGEFTGAGFALGIERSVADVNRAAGRMVGAVSGAARITPAGYSGGGWSVSSPAGRTGLSGAAGAFPEKVQVTVMVDKDVLAETTVPLVDAKMGARLNAVRR